MREIEVDFDNVEFVDVMINELEKEYGRSVARIAKLEHLTRYSFNVSVIFSDFRLLEAEVKIGDHFYSPFEGASVGVQIRGIYY